MPKKIGVVTVTFNSESVLDDFLRCLSEQTDRDFLLYAVDNASTDETLLKLRSWNDARLRVIGNMENLGVAEGYNQGIRAALAEECELVLLLNNDTGFAPTLFQDLVTGLEQFQADMICPKMMYFDEPDRIWAAGGRFQPLLGYRTEHIGADEVDHGQYDEVRRINYVPTCCVLVRKEVFTKVGIMDAKYFVYVDDVDFMFRALRCGTTLIYLPSAKLLHKVGRLTGGKESTFAAQYIARNRMYFMVKHFGWLRSFPYIVLYAAYYCMRLLLGWDDFQRFRLKQSSLLRGIRMAG